MQRKAQQYAELRDEVARLLGEVEPLIKSLIKGVNGVSAEDKNDVAQEVRMELMKRLERTDQQVVRNLHGYTATMFYNILGKLRLSRQKEIFWLQGDYITGEAESDPLLRLPDLSPSPEEIVLNNESEQVLQRAIRRLWETISEIRKTQRAALLLHMDLDLFRMAGIASMREMAHLLRIPDVEFAGLWFRLPLDDQTIAKEIFPRYYDLHVERQKIINLRKCAREYLLRRVNRQYPEIYEIIHSDSRS